MKKIIKHILLGITGMKPTETGQIPGTNIYAVKDSINTVFFIKTDSGYIMIDAGSDPKELEISLKETGIDSNDVKWFFLTHSDFDHVAALTLFPNAKIHMNKDELPLINGTMKRNLFKKNTMPPGINIDKITLLANGQKLSCDETKIECISAPGHTPGSMVYLIDNKYLFTGDAFKISNGNIGVHPFTMDAELAKKTIEQLSVETRHDLSLLTAHYGCIVK
ncbi:MAG: MBL fold metallo-hydrolase [Leptospirales bacterium]|nr:MBL fold metallo-hydrolase [Leptospirales bacterium]